MNWWNSANAWKRQLRLTIKRITKIPTIPTIPSKPRIQKPHLQIKQIFIKQNQTNSSLRKTDYNKFDERKIIYFFKFPRNKFFIQK